MIIETQTCKTSTEHHRTTETRSFLHELFSSRPLNIPSFVASQRLKQRTRTASPLASPTATGCTKNQDEHSDAAETANNPMVFGVWVAPSPAPCAPRPRATAPAS